MKKEKETERKREVDKDSVKINERVPECVREVLVDKRQTVSETEDMTESGKSGISEQTFAI